MNRRQLLFLVGFGLVSLCLTLNPAGAQRDPLPSWNNGPTKQAVIDFVQRVTLEGGPDFVPQPERIAAFDNDGTLWAEQPVYFQFAFALDEIKRLAPQWPEWKDKEPFRSVIVGDLRALLTASEKDLLALMAVTHGGMTTTEFTKTVKDWLATARHPTKHRPYTELVYQPMLELLGYLRANGFKTFIVSGGGVEFIDDGPGKPVGINRFIGRRPILAFGNSDGDLQMLQWTAAGDGLRFMGLVHHTDPERGWAYDRQSHIDRLDKAWDEATLHGWTVVDMKRDWKKVFAFES